MENNHTITHIELPAPDLEKAVDFYSKLFNWQIQIQPQGDYAFFMIGSTQSGGGFNTSLKPAEEKSGPQITIDVDDVAIKLAEVEKAGGKTILGKTEIPGGHGFYACFRDPNGNYLQLHSRK
jgi:predicted enzyme related to lactoylglutathione lyase